MQIIVLSVSHKLASIDIREKVVFHKSDIPAHLKKLKSYSYISGCAILPTCNRSEVIVSTKLDKESIKKKLSIWFANLHDIDMNYILQYTTFFFNEYAIQHISMVASGIDSLVLGEPQILGQLKNSYAIAKENKALDKILEKLFQHSFSVAKKVRTTTKIGNSPVSVAYCGVKLAQKIFIDLSKETVLLIGANEMIRLSAQYFIDSNVKNILIANRTIEIAEKIAKNYNAKAVNLSKLVSYLYKADIIITSTASPVPILGKGMIETALKNRKRSPIFILDMAVPRDVEPEVANLEDVYLYTVDDLEQVIEKNIITREKEKQLAIKIIDEETKKFNLWLKLMPSEYIISEYVNSTDVIKEELITKALKDIKKGKNTENIIRTLANKLTSKLLHKTFKDIKDKK